MKSLSEGVRSLSRYSNPRSPEYEVLQRDTLSYGEQFREWNAAYHVAHIYNGTCMNTCIRQRA